MQWQSRHAKPIAVGILCGKYLSQCRDCLARRVRVGGHRAGAVRVGQAGGELGRGALGPHAARIAHLEAVGLSVAVGVRLAQAVAAVAKKKR